MNRLEPREPLPFEPHFEQIPDDEAETVQEMVDVMRQIADKTYEDSGLGLRCVHAKAAWSVARQNDSHAWLASGIRPRRICASR